MPSSLLLGVWGALTVLALVAAGVSLWMHLRIGSLHELQSQIRSTTGDMAELFDLFEKWTKRERVRRLRDSREEAAAAPQPEAVDRSDRQAYKSFLRKKQRGEVQ